MTYAAVSRFVARVVLLVLFGIATVGSWDRHQYGYAGGVLVLFLPDRWIARLSG